MKEIWSLQQGLLPFVGIGGRCERMLHAIEAEAAAHCDELFHTPGGSLVCHVRGEGEKYMLWADIHSEGFYVTGHDPLGYTRVEADGMRTMDLENTPLRTEDGQPAVLRMAKEPGTTVSDSTPMFLDLGKNDRALAVGTYLVYAAEARRIMNGKRVMAPFCASHVPCAVLLQLMEYAQEDRSGKDLYFVFADGVQNAVSAAFAIDPARAVSVMAVNATDGCEAAKRGAVRLGGGAVLKLRDAYGPCSRIMREEMEAAAKRQGVAWQYDCDNNTNAGYAGLQYQNTGIPTMAAALPLRYKNAPAGIYDSSDVQELVKLLRAYIGGKGEA